MDSIMLPQESQTVLKNTLDVLLANYGNEIDTMRDAYLSEDEFSGFGTLDEFAEALHIHTYTASLAFLFYCAVKLRDRYKKEGLPDELFIDTIKDLKYKNDECVAVKGITGTFVRDWFRWFFQLKRFAFGRFQFEEVPFGKETFTVDGLTVAPGDIIINVHIPYSGIPMTDELRLDAYKKAYSFYKKRFGKKEIPFMCHSWLLYNEEGFIPPKGNIYAFQNEFHIIEACEDEANRDVWRPFLSDTSDHSALPETSSLQRHLKKWLLDGKHFGEGFGVFFFDGEKIV